jgi:biopolymer transport protein TolR
MPKLHPGTDEPSSGRLGRGRRVSSSLSEINVVPLVDVMLVLLIIFMVTAPMIQRGIDVNLPVARRSNQIIGERIEVTVPNTYRVDHMVYLGNEAIRADLLQERVRQKMETAVQKDVYLRGDGAVQLQELAEITDRLQDAGVEHVGLVTKMPGER